MRQNLEVLEENTEVYSIILLVTLEGQILLQRVNVRHI